MSKKRPFYTTLYFRVLVAIATGIAIGIAFPATAVELKPLGDGFINLVKMTIAPLIFCTIVVGITNMKSKAQVGKAGGLAILYFEVASTLALVIGLVIVNVVAPGSGMNAHPDQLDPTAANALLKAGGEHKTTTEFLLGIIPDTFFGALARGELLPVLLVALLFGFALHGLGERGKPIAAAVDGIGHVIFGVIAIIMQAA